METRHRRRIAFFYFAVFIVLFVLSLTLLAASKKSAPAIARKEDIKYIKCEVCNAISKQLSHQVAQKRQQVAPKQLSEYQIIELAENICNLKKTEGDWILHQDIVEEGKKLVLIEHEVEGECNTECKTIEKACQEVMGYHDTDVGEYLYKRETNTESLSKFLCKDLSRVCQGKIPDVPKDRVPGEMFEPKSSKDAEIERIMRSMSDMPGAPGMKVYSKDDLLSGMPNFNEDDEDEDEDDEENIPKKGSSGGFKGSPPNKYLSKGQELMNLVRKGTQTAVLNSQKRLQQASDWLYKWWSGKSDSESSYSKTTEL